MAIFRISKSENFVVLDKGFVNDPDLSWQATGLLTYMLSMPNDWEFHVNDLKNRKTNGRDSTISCIRELESAGYITKAQQRKGGKFSKNEYIIHEVKQPLPGYPLPENPFMEKPFTENPKLLNNKELNNKKLTEEDKGAAPAADKLSLYDSFLLAFGKQPTPLQAQKFYAWVDEGLPELLVAYSFEKASMAGAGLNYAMACLSDWKKKGIDSVEAVKSETRKGMQNEPVQQSSGGNGRPGKENAVYRPREDLADVDLSEFEHKR